MNKIFGKATITNVETTDALKEANADLERCDVRVSFRYDAGVAGAPDNSLSDEELEGVDLDLLDDAKEQVTRNDFSYLWNALKNGFDVGDDDLAVKELTKKLKGKKLIFTTYVYRCEELLKDTPFVDKNGHPYRAVHNESRGYPSFSNSYLLKYDDEESVFAAMQANLISRLEDGRYLVGRSDADVKEFKERKAKERKEKRERERDDD